MRLIGVDVGGTFTDVVFADTDSGTSTIHKVPTTPEDPSEGVLNGILQLCERAGVAPGDIDHVLHGTTTATNAVLEYDGARTGMITSENYRDIIHIGRHQRPQHYSIRQEIPWQDRPLVRRRYRLTVPERITAPKGDVLTPLDEDAVRTAARRLKDDGVEAVAICFLFSYLDPAHEERARAIVEEEAPGIFVTTSSNVTPQFREFERFTTTAMNAFVGPKVRRYVSRLDEQLRAKGLKADLHIMGSNGGVATASMVAERPVLTLLSGPAAGVLGGAWAGELSGRDNLITFDIGGTSADIGIVADGRFAEATARDTWIAGYPLMVPMIDIHTIGAGGGSIAHVDDGGAFRVGPKSAGARPGPAAYGHGGTEPTVTDANVVLGRLDTKAFLGGEMGLDEVAARRVIARLAGQLNLSEMETAEGVLTVVNANMANAIRSRTIQKGLDPRDFSLVAFGGGGPMQAVDVAAMLGIPEVIVPPHPGITSAVGLITTDMKYDLLKTAFQISTQPDPGRIDGDFGTMQKTLAEQFAKDGIQEAEIAFERGADLRYVGQGYELRVAFPPGKVDDAALKAVFKAFEDRHEAEYGHLFPDSPIEIVNLRMTGKGIMPKIGKPQVTDGGSLEDALVHKGACVFREGSDGAGALREFDTAYYRRDRLPLDSWIDGPAVILQMDTTTVVRPQDRFIAERGGNILIKVGL